jgi:hypothetical protein
MALGDFASAGNVRRSQYAAGLVPEEKWENMLVDCFSIAYVDDGRRIHANGHLRPRAWRRDRGGFRF